jgi:hypothetical protein
MPSAFQAGYGNMICAGELKVSTVAERGLPQPLMGLGVVRLRIADFRLGTGGPFDYAQGRLFGPSSACICVYQRFPDGCR